MNGAPLPPDPTAPPHWFLVVCCVLVGLLLTFCVVFVAERIERRNKKRQDEQEVLAETLAQQKEQFEHLRIQTLINQSPGGRKPWQ